MTLLVPRERSRAFEVLGQCIWHPKSQFIRSVQQTVNGRYRVYLHVCVLRLLTQIIHAGIRRSHGKSQ